MSIIIDKSHSDAMGIQHQAGHVRLSLQVPSDSGYADLGAAGL